MSSSETSGPINEMADTCIAIIKANRWNLKEMTTAAGNEGLMNSYSHQQGIVAYCLWYMQSTTGFMIRSQNAQILVGLALQWLGHNKLTFWEIELAYMNEKIKPGTFEALIAQIVGLGYIFSILNPLRIIPEEELTEDVIIVDTKNGKTIN